ncbi:MAG: carbamoyltransferase HypF [Natronomonas sp.]
MPGNIEGSSIADPADAVSLTVTGTVQGVGFRPFVARTAVANGLSGSVRNTDNGVVVHLEGPQSAVDTAIETIRTDPPRLARIESTSIEATRPRGRSGFRIDDSTDTGDRTALVPPDTAVCSDCLADIRNDDSRFSEYWATACVDCGPRFSISSGLPYDRDRTALEAFSLCADCEADYEDRTDRRFHAQTIACPSCGPSVSAVSPDDDQVATGPAAIDTAAERLRNGALVGIMGAGGCHIACRGTDASAVERLRERLGRPTKPFATMAPSVSAVREFVADCEPRLLTSKRRPIVLLPKGEAEWLDVVAPGVGTVGVMLPYSGLHHLLFDRLGSEPIVLTSANRPGVPMATTESELLDLDALDLAVVHDRPIENRCDDSVVRPLEDGKRILRRSRGYVPRPLPLPVSSDEAVLAVGGHSDVTIGATRDDSVVLSQHIGDVSDPETVGFHRETTRKLLDLLDVTPAVVVHDEHPDIETTRIAERRDEPTVAVQHHHAHAASLLAEHERNRAIVVAADGTGYGAGGIVRGGEVLDARLDAAERVGGLSRFRLPGGETAVRNPARITAALLSEVAPERAQSVLLETDTVSTDGEAETVLKQAARGLNSPLSTSAGRFLDSAAALCGVCTERRYQGEPALRLEATAEDGTPVDIDPPIETRRGVKTLDVQAAMGMLAERLEERGPADTAATAQQLLAAGLAEIALSAAATRSVDAIGFTGGVAYNAFIDRELRRRITDAGYTYLSHEQVPPGDGGLSYGQAVVASARLAGRR